MTIGFEDWEKLRLETIERLNCKYPELNTDNPKAILLAVNTMFSRNADFRLNIPNETVEDFLCAISPEELYEQALYTRNCGAKRYETLLYIQRKEQEKRSN